MTLSKKSQGNFAIISGAMMIVGGGFTFLGIIVYGIGPRESEWWMWILVIPLVVMYVVGGGLIDSGRKMRKELYKNEGKLTENEAN